METTMTLLEYASFFVARLLSARPAECLGHPERNKTRKLLWQEQLCRRYQDLSNFDPKRRHKGIAMPYIIGLLSSI